VTASREGGPSLTILSGLVSGNFSAYWMGLLIAGLMAVAFFISQAGQLNEIMAAQLERPSSPTLETVKLDHGTRAEINAELRHSRDGKTSATLDKKVADGTVTRAQREQIDRDLDYRPLVGVGSIFAFGLVAFGFLC